MNNVEFASYADDNTPFFEGDDCKMLLLFKWFNDNQTKSNPHKCHFICSSIVKTSIMIEK